jgi:hypothetical protein
MVEVSVTKDHAQLLADYDQALAILIAHHKSHPVTLAVLALQALPPMGDPESLRTASPSVLRLVADLMGVAIAAVYLAEMEASDG